MNDFLLCSHSFHAGFCVDATSPVRSFQCQSWLGAERVGKIRLPRNSQLFMKPKESLDTGSVLFIGDVKPQWLQGALFAWRHVTVMDAMYVLFTEANGNGWTQGFVIRSRKKNQNLATRGLVEFFPLGDGQYHENNKDELIRGFTEAARACYVTSPSILDRTSTLPAAGSSWIYY